MSKRVPAFRLAFILLCVCRGAVAQTLPISIEPVGKSDIETRTRQVISLAFKVSNRSAGLRTFSVSPALPEGWKNLLEEDWFYLDPGASEIKIASFLVPSGARAGEYPVRCWLRDKDGIFFSTYCDLKVRVSKELSLDLTLLESPRYVLAGQEYSARFAVTNSGNADIVVDASIRSGMSMPFSVEGLETGKGTPLPRGAVREFSVTVKTPPELARSMPHSLQVDMRLLDAEDPQSAVRAPAKGAGRAGRTRATATVELIPFSKKAAALSYALPFTSTTSADAAYYGGWNASLKETVKAEGGLDEAGRHRIALGLAKKVSTDGDLLLDPADRYSLEYSGPLVEAGIGDLNYGVSPLLADRQFGRGAKASLKFGAFRLGALYFKDVWSANGGQDLAATAGWTAPAPAALPDSLYRIGLNLHSPLTDRLSLGLLQEYSPVAGVRALLDAAVQAALDGSWEAASFASTNGSLGPFGWNARFGLGSPGFDGKYSGLLTHSLQASFSPIRGALTLRAGYALRQENYVLDPSLPSAAENLSILASLAGKAPNWKTSMRLEWESVRHDDKLPARLFDSRKNSFRLTAKQPLEPFDLEGQAGFGIGRDLITSILTVEQDHRLGLGYAFGRSAKASLQLRYAGLQSAAGEKSDQILLQGGLLLPLGKAELKLSALNGYRFAQDDYQGMRVSLDARFSYALPKRQSLSARAALAYSSETLPARLSGSLGVVYALPFELPIGRRSDTAIVSGAVLDAESRLPVKGAILRLDGLAAITDDAGKFAFYVPHTGREYLFLEAGSFGEGLVPLSEMPMELPLAKGESYAVEILLAKGCSISGRVSGYGFKDQGGAFLRSDLSDEAGPSAERERLFDLGGMIVEASDGARRWRKLTDSSGAFAFRDLRPGTYVLRVIGGNLPEHFRLEDDSIEIEAAAGSSSKADFRAVEEQRTIKMQEHGLPVEN